MERSIFAPGTSVTLPNASDLDRLLRAVSKPATHLDVFFRPILEVAGSSITPWRLAERFVSARAFVLVFYPEVADPAETIPALIDAIVDDPAVAAETKASWVQQYGEQQREAAAIGRSRRRRNTRRRRRPA